jgi:iron-sulfur cluster assembly protein/iron-sulfur cluster insertion protein
MRRKGRRITTGKRADLNRPEICCGFDSAASDFTVRPMITLTSRAAKQVRSMQAELNVPAKRLRVLVESGGCSGFQYGMSFDEAKPGDAEFESEGVPILVDPASLAYLDGSAIDFDDGLHGKGFEIKNPNAQSTCGCGKSFA